MKDSEFIELLNLYLDHEISAQDAARIEAEVHHNPAHRRLYEQYCRLQKACTLLAKDYVDQAATTGSPADRRIEAFAPRRAWSVGAYAGGFAALAACVAVALVIRSSRVQTASNSNDIVVAPEPAASAAPAISHTVNVVTTQPELKPVFVARGLVVNRGDSSLASSEQPLVRANFNWMKSIELSPIQRLPADELRFESKADAKSYPTVFGPGRTQNDVQQAAFQFQR